MTGQRGDEGSHLLASVRGWFNASSEIAQRSREADVGLSKTERRLLRPLPPRSRLLDIGCAAGRASLALAQAGHAVTGVDVAEHLIAAARRKAAASGQPVLFAVCDPLTLRFAAGSFDAALLLTSTYCYVPQRRNRLAWLREIARVLAPGGWLFLSQHLIDDITTYAAIREDNRGRFGALAEELEDGDSFTIPDADTAPGFMHSFLAADLLAELRSAPFALIETLRREDFIHCTLRKSGGRGARPRPPAPPPL